MPCGFGTVSSVVLLAVPFFILFGQLAEQSGIADRLVAFVNSMVGSIKGAMGVVVVCSSGVFGAMSGAAAASVCAIGVMMVPRMVKLGYPRGYAASLVTGASLLSLLIPPSGEQILYAFVTGQSVAGCFLAIVGPGIMLMMALSLANLWMVRHMPLVVPPRSGSHKQSMKYFAASGWRAIPALFLPVLVLGSIYGGVATATESAAVAVVGALLIGFFVYRGLTLQKLKHALKEAGVATGTIMVIVFFAGMLSRIFILEQLPQKLATALLAISTNKIVILLIIDAFLIVLGMIMDATSAFLLMPALLLPITNHLGVHPFQLAAIMGATLSMGNLTPPVAPILYLGARIGNVTVDEMLKPSYLLMAYANMPMILATTFWPDLSMFLPRLAGYA
jgi:tripartite ATP-independent transporter DctM subunit